MPARTPDPGPARATTGAVSRAGRRPSAGPDQSAADGEDRRRRRHAAGPAFGGSTAAPGHLVGAQENAGLSCALGHRSMVWTPAKMAESQTGLHRRNRRDAGRAAGRKLREMLRRSRQEQATSGATSPIARPGRAKSRRSRQKPPPPWMRSAGWTSPAPVDVLRQRLDQLRRASQTERALRSTCEAGSTQPRRAGQR